MQTGVIHTNINAFHTPTCITLSLIFFITQCNTKDISKKLIIYTLTVRNAYLASIDNLCTTLNLHTESSSYFCHIA
ncbi:hypothetical protein BK640_28685 [Pseudomonas protegens]|nr:hypothetical protein BK639_28750 [Pseudomonas protegens]ROL95076.1 hypothetical protein BK640_28685 [Pseudomonas protegens]ROL97939.1 hypothetical protein BK641_27415 [Pseudomonas protegens]ROM07725.1 hypothetical protein BK642_14315 [Pseudomonas protegens]